MRRGAQKPVDRLVPVGLDDLAVAIDPAEIVHGDRCRRWRPPSRRSSIALAKSIGTPRPIELEEAQPVDRLPMAELPPPAGSAPRRASGSPALSIARAELVDENARPSGTAPPPPRRPGWPARCRSRSGNLPSTTPCAVEARAGLAVAGMHADLELHHHGARRGRCRASGVNGATRSGRQAGVARGMPASRIACQHRSPGPASATGRLRSPPASTQPATACRHRCAAPAAARSAALATCTGCVTQRQLVAGRIEGAQAAMPWRVDQHDGPLSTAGSGTVTGPVPTTTGRAAGSSSASCPRRSRHSRSAGVSDASSNARRRSLGARAVREEVEIALVVAGPAARLDQGPEQLGGLGTDHAAGCEARRAGCRSRTAPSRAGSANSSPAKPSGRQCWPSA